MRMRFRHGALGASVIVFVTFLAAAGVEALNCDGCKMTVTRGLLVDTVQCPNIVCAAAGGACDFHSFQGLFGPKKQCRCGGQGGSRDGCTCLATAQMDPQQPDKVNGVNCERNGCIHDCTNNFGAPGLPVGVPVELCEC